MYDRILKLRVAFFVFNPVKNIKNRIKSTRRVFGFVFYDRLMLGRNLFFQKIEYCVDQLFLCIVITIKGSFADSYVFCDFIGVCFGKTREKK